jgi:ribosome-associated protein
MDIRKLQRVIVDGLEDVKAQNIVVFNTEHLSPLFERVIVASGTSNRQTKSLAASVRDAVKAAGDPPPRTEGEENGEWIIVDCGAAVVHVMQPAIRDYYHLEELWGEKPVKMKIASAAPRLVKRSEANGDSHDGDDHAPSAARGTVRRVAPAKRPASAPALASAKRAATPRAAAPRATPSARGVVRTTGVKRAAAKTTRTAKPAAKKAVAKR